MISIKLSYFHYLSHSLYYMAKIIFRIFTVWKVSKYGVSSVPYFPVSRLNKEIYGVNLRIQSEYGKIRTRKNSMFWWFSRSDYSEFWIDVVRLEFGKVLQNRLSETCLTKNMSIKPICKWPCMINFQTAIIFASLIPFPFIHIHV